MFDEKSFQSEQGVRKDKKQVEGWKFADFGNAQKIAYNSINIIF